MFLIENIQEKLTGAVSQIGDVKNSFMAFMSDKTAKIIVACLIGLIVYIQFFQGKAKNVSPWGKGKVKNHWSK